MIYFFQWRLDGSVNTFSVVLLLMLFLGCIAGLTYLWKPGVGAVFLRAHLLVVSGGLALFLICLWSGKFEEQYAESAGCALVVAVTAWTVRKITLQKEPEELTRL